MFFHLKQKLSYKKINYVLFFILLLASVLRFWNYFNIPFTHDEFSALFRTHYNSFSELIDKGVKVDGHPAGIQVFLYYWVKLVGYSECWIKLPFTLLGIFSIYLFWKIAREWFSEQVAILSSISMAVMQLFIMYSQIARPYISGLFFTLLMVYYWYKIVFYEKRLIKINYYFWFICGATLCNYNHYFSLLMALITGLLGFVFIKKENIKKYCLSLLTIIVFCLPHLKIYLYQFSMGGLGWLGKPDLSFFYSFILYLVNHSLFCLFFLLVMFIGGVLIYIVKKNKFKKEQVIAFILGTLSAVIGYIYSVVRTPVLQTSVLIFSIPFLLLLIFSFFEKINIKFVYGLGLIWLCLLLYSLIFTRHYYYYFYKSIYKETFYEIKETQVHYPKDSTLIICHFRKEVGDYYINQLKISVTAPIIYPYLIDKKELYQYLLSPKYRYLMFSTVTNDVPESFKLYQECFPDLIKTIFLDQGEIRFFKKALCRYDSLYSYISVNTFCNNKQWVYNPSLLKKESNNTFYQCDSLNEYDITYSILNHNLIISRAQIADAAAWIYLPDSFKGKIYFVASMEKDSVVMWQSISIDGHFPKNKWIPVSVSLYFPDYKYEVEGNTIKVYFWNPEHQKINISKTFFGIRNSNPLVYWTYSNIIR